MDVKTNNKKHVSPLTSISMWILVCDLKRSETNYRRLGNFNVKLIVNKRREIWHYPD